MVWAKSQIEVILKNLYAILEELQILQIKNWDQRSQKLGFRTLRPDSPFVLFPRTLFLFYIYIALS